MHIIKQLRDQFNVRVDTKIIECLQIHGLMTEPELQRRTAISARKLQSRLERLADTGSVRFDVTSGRWRIYHQNQSRAA